MAIVSEAEIFRKDQEKRRKDLLSSGTVEDLTRQGRVVMMIDGESGKRGTADWRESSIVFVPPQGVSFRDKVYQLPYGRGYEFFYAGRSMGNAEMIEVGRDEALIIRERRKITLESIGRKDTRVYALIDDEERDRLVSST